jgi:hypothetical protein
MFSLIQDLLIFGLLSLVVKVVNIHLFKTISPAMNPQPVRAQIKKLIYITQGDN